MGRIKIKRTLNTLVSERKHGLFTEQFPVPAYAGSLKDLKDLKVLYGISMSGALILQLRDTMSLIKADLGSVCSQ